jgi:hypothetical protein
MCTLNSYSIIDAGCYLFTVHQNPVSDRLFRDRQPLEIYYKLVNSCDE